MSVPAIVTYVPARPVGERCYHAIIQDDGRGQNHWDRSIPALRIEFDRLWDNDLHPALSVAQHIDYKSALKVLFAKAVVGTLSVGRGPRFDADEIKDVILELKPTLNSETRPAFNKRPRKLRLYFGEPASHDHKLLMLHLDTKEANRSGLDEQDQSICEAIDRAEAWAVSEQLKKDGAKPAANEIECPLKGGSES